jgi:PAS domain S-box-containing protein
MRIGSSTELQRLVEMAEEMAGVGYWRVDAATRIATWSPQVARIHGIEPDEYDGALASAVAFYHPDDQARAAAYMTEALKTGEPFSLDLRIIRKDGQVRRVMAKGAAERDAAGQVVAVFGTFIDVTEARQTEETLRASEARYRMFAENATDMVMMSDASRRLTYISPSVARVTGYAPERLVGRAVAELVHPEDASLLIAVSDRLYAHPDEEAPRLEYRARHRDGRWLWFETRTSLVRDPDTGEPVGAIDVAREITGRKALEAELQARTREAQAATQAKSEFLANMSHEIRTPLNAILGFSALLRRMEGMPPEAGAHLHRITTAGEALLTVVNDVLDFSKLDAGQLELDPHPFEPGVFVMQTVDLVAAQAAAKGLSLELDLDEGLPHAVEADSARLRQILLNLLGNAIKFTEAGGVRVAVSHEPDGGGRLRVTVTDTGAGVPADRLDRLFQRFSQVDASVSRQYGGSGLGLAICKRLAELMGGDIGVVSIEGQGSSFWFTIAAPPAELRAEPAGPGDDFVAMEPRRILVVDDLAANRELVRAVLAPFDHEIIDAAGGEEAVELCRHTPFDLVLMDLQMPGMDGFAAARAIRARAEPNRRTPILALSANVLPEHLHACRAAGMDDHIAKPIDLSELIAKVAHWSAPADDACDAGRSRAG